MSFMGCWQHGGGFNASQAGLLCLMEAHRASSTNVPPASTNYQHQLLHLGLLGMGCKQPLGSLSQHRYALRQSKQQQ